MSAAAMPNNTMSGPCSFSMTPVPLGIAMPLATANPVHCLAEDCSWKPIANTMGRSRAAKRAELERIPEP